MQQIEREDGGMPLHEVVVKRLEPLTVVSFRETTSRASIPGLFEEFDDYLKWSGVPNSVPHMVVWHNCLECESSIDLEIACPIPRKF
ncbi:hypothetical protein [Paenibacillus sp. FSL H7-0331]|uniref:hypothetical protein n=1 Tax=Paenibacillus sp. FSL H7-0331 TaxID=1920421 RepID=UPI0015C401B6|nr:hypothetical protein [Paenibacillus sp. FSL H7-0331]